MTRLVAICADDFGISLGVNRAILDLADRRRISAVSCMTVSPTWPSAAAALDRIRDRADIGLHLTLVDEQPLVRSQALAPDGRMPAIAALIARSHCGLIDRDALRREIEAQFDAFIAATGFVPDYVDGHMHAHGLPIIRHLALEVTRNKAPRAWIRDPREPFDRSFRRGVAVLKTLLISILSRSWPGRTNDGFSGIYDFDGARDYGALFGRFMSALGPRPLVVVHPGDNPDEDIAHAAARAAEYHFLRSDAFTDVMARHDLVVARLSAMP